MKKQLAKLALTAALGLALTLLACEDKEKKQTPAATQQPSQEAAATTFTDPRDSKTYKTVKIGEQVWMAENLNYEAEGSRCYDDKPANCKKYGRLFDWGMAKTACPSGWKLPDTADWNKLAKTVGGKLRYEHIWTFWDDASKTLKSKSEWVGNDNGTDDFGFSALPSGGLELNGDGEELDFDNVGNRTAWWTATELDVYEFYIVYIYKENAGVGTSLGGALFSVRCIQN